MTHILILFCVIIKGFALPNVVDLGAGSVLSHEDSNLNKDFEEHKEIEDPFKAFADTPVKIDEISESQKEVFKEMDDNGSNMVKRLLKNYESYQNALSEKEGAEQMKEGLKSSVFMDHFHNVAGTSDKEEGLTIDADLKIENSSVDTATDNEALNEESKDMKSTTSNIPDQAPAFVDAVPSATTPSYPQENNNIDPIETSDNTDDVDEMYDMSKSYTSTMVHNANEIIKSDDYTSAHENNQDDTTESNENLGNSDSEESGNVDNESGNVDNESGNADNDEPIEGETSEERESRIVNRNGARRKHNGGGPVRISSGSRGNSIDDVFRPRPVYPPSSSSVFSSPSSSVFSSSSNSFGGFPSQQNIHTHIHHSEEVLTNGVRNDVIDSAAKQDVHVHVHMKPSVSEESVLEYPLNQDSDEQESVFDWITGIFG